MLWTEVKLLLLLLTEDLAELLLDQLQGEAGQAAHHQAAASLALRPAAVLERRNLTSIVSSSQ